MKKLFSTIAMFIALVMASAAIANACVDGQLYPSATDCSKYYRCDNGMPIEYTCPAMLHFNAVLQICDWPENAGCDADGGGGDGGGSGGGSKQCYKNPNDGKNDGNCSLRQDSDGSGAYIQVCEQSRYKPSPCETGASM